MSHLGYPYGRLDPKLPALRFTADTSVQPRADCMKLRLRHGFLQAEEKSVVEERRVVQSIRVADQSVCQTAEIEEPVPGIALPQAGSSFGLPVRGKQSGFEGRPGIHDYGGTNASEAIMR